MADSIKDANAKLAEDTKDMSKTFKGLIKGLQSTSVNIAQSAADTRNATKDTFSGLLARRKMIKAIEDVDKVELSNKKIAVKAAQEAINKEKEAQQKALQENKAWQDAQKEVKRAQAKVANADLSDQEGIAKAREELSKAEGDLGKVEENAAAKNKQLNDKNTKNLEEATKERDEAEQKYIKRIEEASRSEGFDEFSDSLKSLTGGVLDLGGWMDSAVGMFSNIQTVFKGIDGYLGGSLSKGFTAITGAFSKGFTAFKGAMTGMLTAIYATTASLLATAGAFLVANAPMIAIALGVLLLAGLLIYGAMKLYESSETFREIIGVVMEYFSSIVTSIGTIFGGFYDFFVGLFTGDFDLMFQGVKDIFGGLWDLIKAPFKAIGDFFQSVFDIDIWAILRRFADKILPKWLVNKIFGDKGKGSDPKAMGTPIDINMVDEDGNELTGDAKDAAIKEKVANMSADEKQAMMKKLMGGSKFAQEDEEKTPVQTVASEALGEEEGNPYERMTDMEAEELQLRKKALEVIRQNKEQGLADLEARYEKGEVNDKQYAMIKRSITGTASEEMLAIKNNASNSFVLEDLRAAEAQERGVDIAGVGLGAYGGDMSTEELQQKGYQDRNAQLYDWQRDPANEGKRLGDFEAKDHLRFDDKTSADAIAEGTEGAKGSGAGNQAIITTVNAPTTNAANTSISTSVPTPRDTDPTGSRLAAVPA